MALELDVFIHVRGEKGMEQSFTPIGRTEGMDNVAYRNAAHEFADAKRREFRKLGIPAVVEVVKLDGMTSEEIQEQVDAAQAIEAAGGTLPSVDEVLARPSLSTLDVLDQSAMRTW